MEVQDKLDEIHDELAGTGYEEPAWKYALEIMGDKFNYNIMDMLEDNKVQKLIKYIRKQINMAREDLKAIDDMAIQDGINNVREDENLGDDVSDDEIKREYEDEVERYAESAQYIFEQDFSDNWEDLIAAVGDFRDGNDLDIKLNRVDDDILEIVEEIKDEYKEMTRDAFKEVFYD